MRDTATGPARSRQGVRRVAAVAAALAVCALASPVTQASAGTATHSRANTPSVTSDVTMVQANVYTGLTVPRFQADIRTILAQQPDFITYNEVMFRNDAILAPAGYDMYRSTFNRFTAETPVAWRSDKWSAIAKGTYRISNWRGVPPHKHVELGRRFANWVTLQGTDGRVVSVVSIHVAPLTRGMPDLLRHSVSRLDSLVATLAPKGPVLVGGDFNVDFRSGRYPRDLFTQGDLVPTYDTLGSFFPTGDHHGSTIDFVFDRGTDMLLANNQYPVELNSDHDAVVAGFDWQQDLPSQTTVVTNNPSGDTAAQRAAAAAVLSGVRAAQHGAVLNLATTQLALPRMVRALNRAIDRGVRVHVVIAGDTTTTNEQHLAAHMTAYGDTHNWLRRCVSTCLATYNSASVPAGFLMVRDPDGQWHQRYDASRQFSTALVRDSSKVSISVGEVALRDGASLFQSIS